MSLTAPNPAFAETARGILEEAGYAVDYYPGEQVTVDFYRGLPAHGYDLIILRVHAARRQLEAGGKTLTDDVDLFTSEPYSETRYLEEQRAERLVWTAYAPSERVSLYFGIPPTFVESSMRGRFGGATVILMGCDGLRSEKMAEAFIRKGARAFVAWDGAVSASHTDAATERLLRHLVIDKLDLPEATARTMREVGPDPSYGARLVFYPSEGQTLSR